MLSSKQNKFLQAVLTESTIQKAAQKSGISRSTAYKYLNDSKFKLCLDKAKNECIHDTIRYLQCNLTTCSEELMKIIKNPETSDQVRINAINTVFQNCKSLIDTCEVEERIHQIEEMIQERGD